MSSLIIVESNTDKYFIEVLIKYLNLNIGKIEIDPPICNDMEYECLEGLGNLEKKIKNLREDKYDNIGIILDADYEGVEKRIKLINEAFKKSYNDDNLEINEQCKFFYSKKFKFSVACYITNVGGKGEIENILKGIKSKDSTYADCLESWKNCLKQKGKEISDKEFDKIWVNNYIRLDTCLSSKNRKNKNKFCSLNSKSTFEKEIWDLEHPLLDDMKKFLKLFNEN